MEPSTASSSQRPEGPAGRFIPAVSRLTPAFAQAASEAGIDLISEDMGAHSGPLQTGLLNQVGRVINPQCEQNQSDPENRKPGFQALKLPYAGERLPINKRLLSEIEIDTYDAAVLGMQNELQSKYLRPPAHIVGRFGRVGRDNDLQLARRARAIVERDGLAIPGPDDPNQEKKPLLISIIAELETLVGPGGDQLQEEYLKLECDGYWVAIADFHEETPAPLIVAGAEWLMRLKLRSERMIFSEGAGELHLPLMPFLDGVSVHVDRRPRFGWPRRTSGKTPRQRVFSDQLITEVFCDLAGEDGLTDAQAVFAAVGCPCGAHDSNLVPAKGQQRALHTLSCRAALSKLSAIALSQKLETVGPLCRRFEVPYFHRSAWDAVAEGVGRASDDAAGASSG